MQALYGIVPTNEGEFCLAAMSRTAAGWRAASLRRWKSTNRFATALLLAKGITLGLPSYWRMRSSPVRLDMMREAQSPGPFVVQAGGIEYDTWTAQLDRNLCAVVPDTAYLCTLPLHLSDEKHDSFLAVHVTGARVLIGVVVQRKLLCVHAMVPSTADALPGHCGRIQRFLATVRPDTPFPEHLFLFDGDAAFQVDGFQTHSVALDRCGLPAADADALKAAGAALASCEHTVPAFAGASAGSRLRHVRSALIVGGVAVFLAGLASVCYPLARLAWGSYRLAAFERTFHDILSSDGSIRALLDENDKRARKVIRLTDTFSRRTAWHRFLGDLAAARPGGLYLERLGSEPAADSSETMRIAIAGWAENEAIVTAFISKLQNMRSVSDVALIAIEQSTQFRFRIVCTLAVIRT